MGYPLVSCVLGCLLWWYLKSERGERLGFGWEWQVHRKRDRSSGATLLRHGPTTSRRATNPRNWFVPITNLSSFFCRLFCLFVCVSEWISVYVMAAMWVVGVFFLFSLSFFFFWFCSYLTRYILMGYLSYIYGFIILMLSLKNRLFVESVLNMMILVTIVLSWFWVKSARWWFVSLGDYFWEKILHWREIGCYILNLGGYDWENQEDTDTGVSYEGI